MKRLRHKLLLEQIEQKVAPFAHESTEAPPEGWIKTIRGILGMSMRQLSERMGVTTQAVNNLEKREIDGRATLAALEGAARAMNMKLVYALVPASNNSLDSIIEERAIELAKNIIARTNANMSLEDQAVSNERIQKAIKERAAEIKHEMPKYLWD